MLDISSLTGLSVLLQEPVKEAYVFTSLIASKPSLALGLCVVAVVLTEIVIYVVKHRLTTRFRAQKIDLETPRELEILSLDHFRREQILDISRAGVYFFLALGLTLMYDVNAFSYLLIALGALIIVLKELVTSFVGYFFVLLNYAIGDDVRVDKYLGEISRIRLLSTSLIGKDEIGEYNGKLYTVPNYHFYHSVIEEQELKSSTLQHSVLKVVYAPERFTLPFSEWITALEAVLTTTLPVRSVEGVGHFRGFTGARYKIDYSYNDTGYVVVTISFISSPKTILTKKTAIVHHIESTKLRELPIVTQR